MLNNRQQEVILDNSNELLVLAGAGSGKTHCVTEKIKSLLNNGYNISEIVAITFTNKAADEMIERISKFNYINKMNSNISTFHSFCYKILKDNLNFLGLSNVRICDDNQSTSLLGEAVEIVLGTKDGSSRAKQEIEKLKNKLIYPDNIEINKYKWISSIYKEYEKLLKQCSLLDFNDLISKTVLLLKENSLLREKYQKQFKFIIVDEFQDVNKAQFELIRELHNPIYNKLMVVGDDSQCVSYDTNISLENCVKSINNVKKNDKCIVYKNSKIQKDSILHCDRSYMADGIKIYTKSGNYLTMTYKHKIWATPILLNNEQYYVYLMYRKDLGFRVGMSKKYCHKKLNTNKFSNNRPSSEKATKLWVLEICDSKTDALFKESMYSLKYGIPTIVFEGESRGLDQNKINKIFNIFGGNGSYLLKDKYYEFNYPHWQATGYGKNVIRRVISLISHCSKYTSIRLEWSGEDLDDLLNKNDFRFSISKNGHRRLRKYFENYRDGLSYALKLKNIIGCDLIEKINTKFGDLLLLNSSQLFVGMKVISKDSNNNIFLDEIVKIENIENEEFYTLDINSSSNFFGNNILSHNSIYGFRYSDPSYIIDFKEFYPNSNTIKLEQNYRSTQKILNTANYVINKNEKGIKKELWTNNDNGENIDVIKFNGEKEQANFIANLILKNKDIKKFKDYCILYRINSQSRIIEDALAVRNIPAKVIHGVSFYDRAEVKDIMSYLRFIDNPNDIFSFRRCIQTPKRGIGKKTIDKIIEESKNKSIIEVLQSYNDKVKVFSDFIIKARSMRHDSVELIKFIMLETGYNSYLKEKAKTNEELINRTESIEQIINMSIKETEDKSVQSLLDYMSLRTDNASTDKDDAVRLSTIHSSKGLEFDTVFLISMNQGVFPHESLDTEIEEARRLFYVAVTRAKNKLCITHTMSSVKYGTIIFNQPSLFLSDLPKEGINKIGGSYDFFD